MDQEQQESPSVLYGPVATVAITVFIYIASQLAAAVFISILPILLGWSTDKTTDWVQDNVWGTFSFVFLVEAVTLWLLYQFVKRRKATFNTLGLDKLDSKHFGLALVGFAAYFILYIVALIIVKAVLPNLDLEQKQEIGFQTTTQGSSLIAVFLSLVILPPITEEIVARGFLFGGLRTKLPFISAAIITSTLFAAAHLGAASDGLLWVAGIDTFILSLVLCYLREKTGSLWPSIIVHMIKNGLAFFLLFNIIQYFR